MNPSDSQQLLLHSALCVPDVPLPLKTLRQALDWTPERFQQAQTELIARGEWIDIPHMGVLLPVAVWKEPCQKLDPQQIASFLASVLKQAQAAMSHHSRLAQLAAIREMGPHLPHFSQQAEHFDLPESPYFWQVMGAYLQAIGKATEAKGYFQRALNSLQMPSALEWQLEIHQQLGKACQTLQHYEEARLAYQTACSVGIALYGETDARFAPLVENLGQLAFLQNDFSRAIALYRQTLAIDQAAQSSANRVASRWNNLGRVYQASNDLPTALTCFQQAAALWQSEGVSEHHVNQALALKNMGLVYQQMGNLPQAKASLESAIECSERFYGKDHPDIGRDASLLAGILQELGEYENALSLFRRAVQIDVRSFGQSHPEVALTLNNLGVLLAQMGRMDDARETLQEAQHILEHCTAPDHPYRQQVTENICGLQGASNSIQSKHVSNNS